MGLSKIFKCADFQAPWGRQEHSPVGAARTQPRGGGRNTAVGEESAQART